MKDTNLPIKYIMATNHTKHKSQTDKQITGNAGMFYVCYHLSRNGWNVMPTARNARGIDILAYAQEGDDFLTVQVKTLSKKDPIPVGSNLHNLMANYWTVVVLEEYKVATWPTVYIFTNEEFEKALTGLKLQPALCFLSVIENQFNAFQPSRQYHLLMPSP